MISNETRLDKWWASLKVTDKERIAFKITGKKVLYPECTDVWKSLTEEQQTLVKNHCVKKHGNVLMEWNDGDPMTD